MASTHRLLITSPAWTIQATDTYNSASPADSPSAFPESAAAFDARLLTALTGISNDLGVLVTFHATARPAAFVGVRVRALPTYSGSVALEMWTYDGSTWTQQRSQLISADQNDGVLSGASYRVWELWVTTPVANVQQVWVTFNNASMIAGYGTVHLYESRAETTTAPFDITTGQPFDAADDPRPRAATVAALAGTTFALAYQLDRTPDPGDDTLDAEGGWSVLDLPAAACAQIADEHGSDVIVLAVNDLDNAGTNEHRVVTLDWDRFQDEWAWDEITPLYRRWKLGPIPHLPDNDNTETTARYELDIRKRFRRLEWELQATPTDATTAVRVTVEAFGLPATARVQAYTTTKLNQVQIAVQGHQFSVLLEHAANEPFSPLWWKAFWDLLGPRLRGNRVVS